MIELFFLDLHSMFHYKNWLAQPTIFTTQNERIQDTNGGIKSTITGALQQFLNADKVVKAEINKPTYSVELLKSNAGVASLLDRVLASRKISVEVLL